MKCYYCDTEFQGYKCPKCLAVYTVEVKENEGGIAEEDVHKKPIYEESAAEEKVSYTDEEKIETQGKRASKKGKAIEAVIDIVGEIAEVIIENLFD